MNTRMKLKYWAIMACIISFCPAFCLNAEQALRFNQIQVIGTHNSYKMNIHPSVMKVLRQKSEKTSSSLDYGHVPLGRQFSKYGMRKIELDVFADPEGGLFAHPLGRMAAEELGLPPVPDHDPEGLLEKPGFKVLHVPDIDYQSTVLTFVNALQEVRDWSQKHSRHVPILVMVELKDRPIGPEYTQPVSFDRTLLMDLESEILSVFEANDLITPDDIRKNHNCLREAILTNGWPLLDEVRGQLMFALDNTDAKRDLYLEGNPSLEGRLLFTSVDEGHPAAAWFKINDPVLQFERIQSLVRHGFMVRTRADADTVQARIDDRSQLTKALLSGAQFISTDYPAPRTEWSSYAVRFKGGAVARPNPVSTKNQDLELEVE